MKLLESLGQDFIELWGANIRVVRGSDYQIYLFLSDLSAAFGFEERNYRTLIENDRAISEHALAFIKFQVPATVNYYAHTTEVICLLAELLPFLLVKLDASRVPNSSIRANLIDFQRYTVPVLFGEFGIEIFPQDFHWEMEQQFPEVRKIQSVDKDEFERLHSIISKQEDQIKSLTKDI